MGLTEKCCRHGSTFVLSSNIVNKRFTQKNRLFPTDSMEKEALSSYDWLFSLALSVTDTVVSNPSR
ncbi:hypothetical protein BJQ97_00421 [Geobacillus sp. TFV-3]|nr:hypothetical protein BJQ97_00421 [Geobacillus sp. TFV-3]